METPPRSYSPFWPLQLLVICLGIWIGYHVFSLYEERQVAEERIQQILPEANASLAAKKRLLALAQSIDQLAAKDTAAAQIVSEFKIREQNASQPQVSPAGSR